MRVKTKWEWQKLAFSLNEKWESKIWLWKQKVRMWVRVRVALKVGKRDRDCSLWNEMREMPGGEGRGAAAGRVRPGGGRGLSFQTRWARTRGATTCRSSSATCLSCARTPCSTKALFAGQKAQELDPELTAYEHFFFLDLFILKNEKWELALRWECLWKKKVRISFEVRMPLREKWESFFWVLARKLRIRVGCTLRFL